MTEIAELTGIPLTTLSDMKDETWRPKVLDRLDSLGSALNRIDRQRPALRTNRKGRATATA